jgi:hypothetical protein
MVVETVADLLDPVTWTANDGGIYAYKGMIVAVSDDGLNTGAYELIDVEFPLPKSLLKCQ